MNWRRQVLMTSILRKRRFIPPRRIWTHIPSQQEFVSKWPTLTGWSHYAISLSQSRNNSWEQSSSRRQNSDLTHGSSYLLQQRDYLYPSEDKLCELHMSKYKVTSPENYWLASYGDTVSLPVTQTGCTTKQLSSVQRTLWHAYPFLGGARNTRTQQ
jgi:hypothetical protein